MPTVGRIISVAHHAINYVGTCSEGRSADRSSRISSFSSLTIRASVLTFQARRVRKLFLRLPSVPETSRRFARLDLTRLGSVRQIAGQTCSCITPAYRLPPYVRLPHPQRRPVRYFRSTKFPRR